ncbi:helix-turn-helix transcriptional regulator [Staphylococcus saprophyticus]|nr:helix-turn-helix transcriptional regulator [Staphylococcus saprophyticus]
MQLITKSKEIDKRLLDMDKSQTQAAREIGYSKNAMNTIVRGRSNSLIAAHKLVNYLGGNFEDYFKVDYSDEEVGIK